MREKGNKETPQLRKNLAQTPQPGLGGYLDFIVSWGLTTLTKAFLAVCYGVSPRGISLCANSSSVGYFGQLSWA